MNISLSRDSNDGAMDSNDGAIDSNDGAMDSNDGAMDSNDGAIDSNDGTATLLGGPWCVLLSTSFQNTKFRCSLGNIHFT